MCLLPRKILKAINSICARFLWNGKAVGRCCHLIDWNTVCLDKKEGGLGIKNLETMNDAMVLNQLWDLNKDNLNVSSQWIKAYWTKGTHWWENNSLINSSWVLRRLAYCKTLSWKCIEVVNGSVKWIEEGKGFSVKDTYQTLKARSGQVDWYKLVWNRVNTPRASLNAVLVARDRLLTKSRLRHMRMNVELKCVLCNEEEEENRDHLFFQCRFSRAICGEVLNFLGVSGVPVQWHLLIPWFNNLDQEHIRTRMIAAAITGMMYEIWSARNNFIFRGKDINRDSIVKSIIWCLKVKIDSLNSHSSRVHDRNWRNSMGMS